MQQAMNSLSEALESGDLEGAKSSFSQLKSMMPPMGTPPPPPGGEASGTSDESTSESAEETLADYIEELQEALESDNIDAAREAFAKIQEAAKSMPQGPPPDMMNGAAMFSNLSLYPSSGTIDTAV